MEITSPEFYTIAFVVAMALVALLMGRSEKKTPSTYIVQLLTTPDDEDHEDEVRFEPLAGNKLRIVRTGFTLLPEETVNLVITMRDDECSIVEKKGVKRRGPMGDNMRGEVTVKCFRPIKYSVRYESQLTSTWATFSFDAASSAVKRVVLNY